MAARANPQTLGPLAAAGMATQLPQIDLPPHFGTMALNAFADEAGRPTARFSPTLRANGDASGSVGSGVAAYRLFRHNNADGTTTLLVEFINGKLYEWDGSTFTLIDTFPTNAYQYASLNGKIVAATNGATTRIYDEATLTGANASTPSSVKFSAVHAAYGRMWATDGKKLYWSVLLDAADWGGSGSGSLDLQHLHVGMRDTALAIVSFNRQIVVLNANSITVLAGDSSGGAIDEGGFDPNSATQPIYLKDFIPNVGLYARDSVVAAADDVLFLASDGVRSLARSLQQSEGPAPLTDVSQLNKDYIVNNLIAGNTHDRITGAWDPRTARYILFGYTTNEAYVFDFGRPVPESRLPRTFLWRFADGQAPACAVLWTDGMIYGGQSSIRNMNSYSVNETYSMVLRTGWLSLADAESMDLLKRALVSVTGGSGQTATLRWWTDFKTQAPRTVTFKLSSATQAFEYGLAEYGEAEYSTGMLTADTYPNIGGESRVVMFELDIPISGVQVTINNMAVFYKAGKLR